MFNANQNNNDDPNIAASLAQSQQQTVDNSDKDIDKTSIPKKLLKFINSKNIAENLSNRQLDTIGDDVDRLTKLDEDSRSEWMEQMGDALKIAKQVTTTKSYPWQNASNILYPLLLNACVQFNARTNPEIAQDDKVVFVDVMADDPEDKLKDQAERLSGHMSYQLIGISKNWRRDTDKLLMILPLMGTVFRKSFYNYFTKMPDSELCLPDDIIINNNAKSLETAARITHCMTMTTNQIIERQKMGLYLDIDIDELISGTKDISELDQNVDDTNSENETDEDDINILHDIYEQHTWLDLDDDGYGEPYIVVVHKNSQKVLRIVARYDQNSLIFNEDNNELAKIEAIQYFTDYHLIPSPDGKFYSMGFGTMLYPINNAINTNLNQLVDAGTLSNLQGGFLGSNLRLKKGKISIKPGQWETVDNRGQNLKDNIVPLPVKEPSDVLFQLVQFLVQTGKEISTVTDVLQGQQMPANTPATTVLMMVEQGSRVFSSIQLRLYESLKSEFNKLYELNKKYLTKGQFFKSSIKSGMIQPFDYANDNFGIFPVANPVMSTTAEKMAQAQALMELMSVPNINTNEIVMRYLAIFKIKDPEKIMPPSQPPLPDPMTPLLLAKAQADIQYIKTKIADIVMGRELDAIDRDIELKKLRLDAEDIAARIASTKIASTVQIAEVEMQSNAQQVEMAQKTVDAVSQGIESSPVMQEVVQPDLTEQELGQIQDFLQQEIAPPPPNMQQGTPPGMQPGQPGGMLGDGDAGAQGGMPGGMPPGQAPADQPQNSNPLLDQLHQELMNSGPRGPSSPVGSEGIKETSKTTGKINIPAGKAKISED